MIRYVEFEMLLHFEPEAGYTSHRRSLVEIEIGKHQYIEMVMNTWVGMRYLGDKIKMRG